MTMARKPSILSANGEAFEEKYWKEMYVEDEESVIDGLFNAEGHARYAKALFRFMDVDIRRIGDFGFGLGLIIENFALAFNPKLIIALDPSEYCVQNLLKKKWIKNFNLAVHHSNFHNFKIKHLEENPLDLLIMNSVLQYFPTEGFEAQIERLSRICKYLYITLPTKKDYKKMEKDFDFIDPYAYSRNAKFYKDAFRKHFSIVSYNLMESRKTKFETPFLYELFRS